MVGKAESIFSASSVISLKMKERDESVLIAANGIMRIKDVFVSHPHLKANLK